MAVTVTANQTLADVLNKANPNQLGTALQLIKMGRMLNPVKITLAAITAASAVVITGFKKGDSTLTINAGLSDLATGDALPKILSVRTLRVTTSGTANSVGSYAVSDAGGTAVSPTAGANVGLALLSDDGTTLTFLTTVTGLVLEYIPQSATAFSTIFNPLPSGL